MENTQRLYCELLELFGQHGQWRDVRHLYTLIWMVVGLLSAGGVSLTAWVPFVSSRARYAQSTQRRFARWLHNGRIEVHPFYASLIQKALATWGKQTVYLALDTTRLWNRYCVMRIVVSYRGRAVPLVWEVLEHGSSSVAYEAYASVLEAVPALLPPGVQVIFLADRGFADTASGSKRVSGSSARGSPPARSRTSASPPGARFFCTTWRSPPRPMAPSRWP